MPNDALGALLVNQGGMPPYTEATRSGVGWTTMTATAFTPLVVVPSTLAALEIYNNSSNSGAGAVDLIIDEVFGAQILGTAAQQANAIWVQVTAPKAVPTVAALTVGSLNGRAPYTAVTGGKIVPGINTTVIASGWRPWGANSAWGLGTATPGPSWAAAVSGKLIVPPGCSLCVHLVGALATASSGHVGATWYEAALTNVL